MRRRTWWRLAAVGMAILVVAAFGARELSSWSEYSFIESFGIVLVVFVAVFIVLALDEA